jgi:hypothetical protein
MFAAMAIVYGKLHSERQKDGELKPLAASLNPDEVQVAPEAGDALSC